MNRLTSSTSASSRSRLKKKSATPPHQERLYRMDLKYIVQTIRAEGWAFIFICTYLFFEYVRPQSIWTWLDVLPWVPMLLGGALIALFVDQKRQAAPHVLNKLMVLYFGVVILSSVFSQYPSVSFGRLWTFYNWFIIYFLIVKIVTTPARFFIFFLSFLIYSLKMSQHGFITWAQRGFSFADWGVTGAPGFFQNSGELGIQMTIYVPMAAALIIGLRPYWHPLWRVFFYAMPLTGLGTLIATSSRGAMVGLAASCVMALVKTRYFFRMLIVVAVLGAIIWQVVPEEFKARFDTAGDDRTSLHRIERWEDGWQTINEFPFLGVGHNAWEVYYANHFSPEISGSNMVHNVFIQCGTELGYAGLFALGLLLFYSLKTTRQIRRQAKEIDERFYYFLTYGFDLGLVGLLISASFVTVLYYPFLWIYFALVASMQVSFRNGLKSGALHASENEAAELK
ncbi:hypothetical protein CLH62_01815 [Marinobacter guineae]|uniref:O-antigen ligase-related domain-containing protein n=1 Tax=Marinobacter guineae TaxID=432303 RepID=A0A2G1VIE4_9GAMM|nr:O-antigen ligase family protein [Marinobacter guineae]PHQ26360.1 hypothetical protein CLH62_01815 [Marinobacter guineae]